MVRRANRACRRRRRDCRRSKCRRPTAIVSRRRHPAAGPNACRLAGRRTPGWR